MAAVDVAEDLQKLATEQAWRVPKFSTAVVAEAGGNQPDTDQKNVEMESRQQHPAKAV